ncbi:hypothetical protein C8J57DRAFT_1579788 [Mycena rebaudengoi]|nr:hypothetical protein C8J57DRAFT_1579788 [Mycena rebaudengoi]
MRLTSFLAALASAAALHAKATSEFEWTKLTPSERLEWKPCYSGFQCSRLQVPLDYSAPHKGVATIAVAKYPSTSPKSQYRGPVLFNPGGPGASGVELIVETGAAFATVLGAQFDIVGFDPRDTSNNESHYIIIAI